jgi:hypothetical protein
MDDPFKDGTSINSPFNSIDRAITQIIMFENNVTHAQANRGNDTTMDTTKAIASRSYVFKMLPGEYMHRWGDGSVSGSSNDTLNRVHFPDWDRSLTIESYYTNIDSYCVYNIQSGSYSSALRIAPLEMYTYASGAGYGFIRKYHIPGHYTINRLKITSALHKIESPTGATIFGVAGGSHSFVGVRFTNNICYSMDSTQFKTIGRRYLQCMYYGHMFSGGSFFHHFDNHFFANNLFHRMYRWSAYQIRTQPFDYCVGTHLINNTHFNWRGGQYWTGHGHYGKISVYNSIIDSSTNPWDHRFTNPSQSILADTLFRTGSPSIRLLAAHLLQTAPRKSMYSTASCPTTSTMCPVTAPTWWAPALPRLTIR